MPNRIIRESICTSDSIDGLSWFEEVLFYRLIVSCDDFGRYDGRAAIIKNRLFPLKENLTLKTVENALHGLASAGLVALYTSQGKRFLYLPTWGKYQNQRAKESKYPEPVEPTQADEIICKQMNADVPVFENRESIYENREARIMRARRASLRLLWPKFRLISPNGGLRLTHSSSSISTPARDGWLGKTA